MVGETNSMVGYYLMAEDHSIQLGVWAAPWWELGLKKMFENLKVDTF